MLVSRLEGPVTYPPEAGPLTGLHAGSHHASFHNPDPDVPPEINVSMDRVALVDTRIPRLQRQTAFDHASIGSARRMVQWRLKPETVVPPWQASEGVQCWASGGSVMVNGTPAHANCFVVIEPGARVGIKSASGALILVWADSPECWPTESPDANLFGF